MLKSKKCFKAMFLILCFSVVFIVTSCFPVTIMAYTQTGPITVANALAIQSTGATMIDCPWSCWTAGGTRYWITSENWGDNNHKWSGTRDWAIQTQIFNKTRSQFYTNNAAINGKPWVVNIYKDPNGGLLAFLHIEFAAATYTPGGSGYKGRIALAYSTDNGDTFTYCGEIIAPYGDPDMSGGFLQGCPYVVKDGYFYIYYNEGGAVVARAPVTDVLNAAKNGTTCSWYKYYNGGWTQPGMFGNRSYLVGTSGWSVSGINHTQAAYSIYDGKYYMITTMKGGTNNYIRLWQSSDAVKWDLYQTICKDDNMQYSSIVDYGNEENATVGQLFYVYCGNLYNDPNNMSMKRWTIDLSGAPISLYNLDGNTNDSAGFNNGTLQGGATYVSGKRNQALQLDGVDDYVNIPDSNTLTGMGMVTVSAWVNLSQLPVQSYCLVGKDQSYGIYVNSSGTGYFKVGTLNNSWDSSGTTANFTTALSTNTWYHIVGTYDGAYVKVYVNGSLKGTGSRPVSNSIATNGAALQFGNKTNASIDYTKGIVDEVQIYNKSLSATEILNLYNMYSMSATPHTATTEFSSTQGTNGWYYKEWNGSTYLNMTLDGSRWKGSETYSLIMNNAQHPGANVDSSRIWQASTNANIEIKGNAKMNQSGLDGVIVSILKNSQVIWTRAIEATDTVTGVNFDILTNVVPGDNIYFKVNKNINNYFDSTLINPTIIVYN